MIKEATQAVVNKKNLTKNNMIEVMNEIMNGEADTILLSSFLTALKMKGETAEEIAGAAKVMREKAERVNLTDYDTVDTCGTGGDCLDTFNISTGVALVLASADVKVVKHGNRSISSKCGGADVLEALKVNINLNKEQVKDCVLNHNIGFMFAPKFHQAMKYAMPVRKTLGFRTLFNILGPLSNPALAKSQLLGVYDGNLTEVMAESLGLLGVKRAMVVHGEDGLDEISISAPTKVTELINGNLRNYIIKPEDFGLTRAKLSDVTGGGKEVNAQILLDLFQGARGPKRDILLLNCAAALYVSNKVESIDEGIEYASKILDSGLAYEKLQAFASYTEVIAS
ncbi:MAG: anthranilate phosphoribosyltransferase [Eubacteriales bacterium]